MINVDCWRKVWRCIDHSGEGGLEESTVNIRISRVSQTNYDSSKSKLMILKNTRPTPEVWWGAVLCFFWGSCPMHLASNGRGVSNKNRVAGPGSHDRPDSSVCIVCEKSIEKNVQHGSVRNP